LSADELDCFAAFLAQSLGFYVPGAPELYRARALAEAIVDFIRDDLRADFVSCNVVMDDNGLSGSADLMAIQSGQHWHHLVTLDWQVD
jgi:hypothetical protein